MEGIETGQIYIAIPGDPLSNLATARHFFGDDFRVKGQEVLVSVGKIFKVHLRLRRGIYQTYFEIQREVNQWKPLTISWTGVAWKLWISDELWCIKKPNLDHAYFPDENSRILFEKYFGIR